MIIYFFLMIGYICISKFRISNPINGSKTPQLLSGFMSVGGFYDFSKCKYNYF